MPHELFITELKVVSWIEVRETIREGEAPAEPWAMR